MSRYVSPTALEENASQVFSECSRKKRYSTKHFANEVAKKVKKRRGDLVRVYECPSCQGFHLTRMDVADWKNQKG
jgi:ribosomal protein L37AE/L43A